MFLSNLLIGMGYELKNRYMHTEYVEALECILEVWTFLQILTNIHLLHKNED